jgi:3-hydroxybutyryl-CoA dehydrogenase
MGSGIAQVAAQAGASVVVFDTQAPALDSGRKRVTDALAALVKRAKLDGATVDTVLSRIAWTDDLADLADADLVIEAIVEREEAKADLFRALETLLAVDAIIATNTSSLSISQLAKTLTRPERFVGMHFFNPAPVMKLVEIVGGDRSDRAVIDAVAAAATSWGKSAVAVADVPGFIVNRVARPFYAEAFKALAERAAAPQLIDHLFRSGAGFRMGPFELTDLIGQDVNYAVACSIYDGYGGRTRFVPEPAQASLVDARRFGRKNGDGVFSYAEGVDQAHILPSPEPVDTEVTKLIREPKAAFARLEAGLHGRAPRGFIAVGDVLIGFSEGLLASSEARKAGRDVALYDWAAASPNAPLAFSVSSDAAAAAAAALASSVGREAFRVVDRPGLIVLRALAQLVNAAADAALDEVADEDGIDTAMRFGANYPYGLFEWANGFGRDNVARLLGNIASETGNAMYAPSAYLRPLL